MGMKDSSVFMGMGTEDVWVVEINIGVLDRVAGVDEDLTFSIELDGVGGFVDSIVGENERLVAHFLGEDSDVLFIHILDVSY